MRLTKQEQLDEGICIVCFNDDVECLNNCTKHMCIYCGVHQEYELDLYYKRYEYPEEARFNLSHT